MTASGTPSRGLQRAPDSGSHALSAICCSLRHPPAPRGADTARFHPDHTLPSADVSRLCRVSACQNCDRNTREHAHTCTASEPCFRSADALRIPGTCPARSQDAGGTQIFRLRAHCSAWEHIFPFQKNKRHLKQMVPLPLTRSSRAPAFTCSSLCRAGCTGPLAGAAACVRQGPSVPVSPTEGPGRSKFTQSYSPRGFSFFFF